MVSRALLVVCAAAGALYLSPGIRLIFFPNLGNWEGLLKGVVYGALTGCLASATILIISSAIAELLVPRH